MASLARILKTCRIRNLFLELTALLKGGKGLLIWLLQAFLVVLQAKVKSHLEKVVA
jgi:hypothetical protein